MNSNRVWGGGEKWHFETACRFRDLGYSVTVIANKNSELCQKLENERGINLESVRISNLCFLNPFRIFHIIKLFKRKKFSAVILGLPIDLKVGGISAKCAGVRNIIYRRGAAVPVKNSISNRFLFRSVITAIICNSREIRNKIFQNNKRIIADEKVHVIYNGIDPRRWLKAEATETQSKSSRRLILGNAGRLVEQKGQHYLISVAKQLKEQDVDFVLYIAGEGNLEKVLKDECSRNDLEEEVVFLGFIENMQDFLAGLDIYLSTSIHEGSSNVIIEAMAMGKPVIGFDVSSMPELIVHNETGYLVPFGETQPFAEKIIFLKNNKLVLDTFAANARKQVERKFNLNNITQQIIELIEEKK